ncbi:MAG: response regulator [Alphaproteobacteria bacterium]
MKILLVEDDIMIGQGLQKALRQSGYSVDWVQDGLDVEPAIEGTEYALIILDLGIPGKDGTEVLKSLRMQKNDIPVLILTARDSIPDRVSGLDIGADDYMIKPFALEELEARIRLLLRRRTGTKTNELNVKDLTLNLNTHEITYGNKHYVLSAKEFALLRLLMEHPKNVFSRTRLEESLYGWNEEVESNSVEVHIHQIRKKLGKNIIRNTRNVGYQIGI